MKSVVFNSFLTIRKFRLIWLLLCLMIFAGLFWIASGIGINEDISKTFPDSDKIKAYKELFLNSSNAGKLIIALHRDDSVQSSEDLVNSVEFLNQELETFRGSLLKDIFYKVRDSDIEKVHQFIYEHLPLFMDEQDVNQKLLNISDSTILRRMQSNLNILLTPGAAGVKSFILKDPLGLTGDILSRFNNLQSEEMFIVEDGFLFSEDRSMIFLMIDPEFGPAESKQNEKLINAIDQSLIKIEESYPGVEGLYFGSTALSVANSTQIKQDIRLTATIAVMAIIILIGVYYRNVIIPILFMIPAIGGGIVGLAIFTLVKGSISAISMGAGSVILGIAIDYSFHFFTDLKHNKGDIGKTLLDVSNPLTLGCITTAGAFFILIMLNSPILVDFGILAGFSLIGAGLITLFILPQIVDWVGYRPDKTTGIDWMAKVTGLRFYRPVHGIIFIVGTTLFLSFFINDVQFDDDLNNLNYFPDHLKEAQKRIFLQESNDYKTVFVVTDYGSLQTSLEVNERLLDTLNLLEDRGGIERVSSLSSVLTSERSARKKIQLWNDPLAQQARIELMRKIQMAGQDVGFSNSAFSEFGNILENEARYFNNLDSLIEGVQIFESFLLRGQNGISIVTNVSIDEKNKSSIIPRLESIEGVKVLDQTSMAKQLARIVGADFNFLLLFTAGVVLITLLIAYGRIELALMTFLPMALSWVWILGVCGLLGVKFNIVNVIITTFIFGLGDDYCIFVTEGILSKYRNGKSNLVIFKNAIFLSVISTIIGTGVLFFAEHPALKSIALLAVIGMISILFISFTLQPLIFDILVTRRERSGSQPISIKKFLASLFAFLLFFLGCLILVMIGIIMKAIPVSRKEKKSFYQSAINKFAYLIINIFYYGNVEKVNYHTSLFDIPGIVVCNHTSFIDILVTLLIHPKTVMMTNKWVWNSPFFGLIVRFAEFIYIHDPVEVNEKKIKKNLDMGYSIIVFPEGTRSTDGNIARFHKGAFYIADKFNLPLYPVVLSGLENSIAKGDFLYFNKKLTLKFLPQLTYDEQKEIGGLRDIAKDLRKKFREEYRMISAATYDFNFYKDRLRLKYRYKGIEINKSLENFIKDRINLKNLINLLPHNLNKVLVYGAGYGFLCEWMALARPGMSIEGIEYDKNKFEFLLNATGSSPKLRYNCTNPIMKDGFPNMEYIIIDTKHCEDWEDLVDSIKRQIGSQKIIINHSIANEGNKQDNGILQRQESEFIILNT